MVAGPGELAYVLERVTGLVPVRDSPWQSQELFVQVLRSDALEGGIVEPPRGIVGFVTDLPLSARSLILRARVLRGVMVLTRCRKMRRTSVVVR